MKNWYQNLVSVLGQSFINLSCNNSKISHIIDMKFGPVTKLERQKTATSKKLTIASCCQIMTSSSFFQLMANLQPDSGRMA